MQYSHHFHSNSFTLFYPSKGIFHLFRVTFSFFISIIILQNQNNFKFLLYILLIIKNKYHIKKFNNKQNCQYLILQLLKYKNIYKNKFPRFNFIHSLLSCKNLTFSILADELKDPTSVGVAPIKFEHIFQYFNF